MSKKFTKVCACCFTIVVMLLSGCKRENSSHCLRTSEVEFEKSFRSHLRSIKGLVELRKVEVSESVSNAYAKAERRKELGANYRVVPVFCSVREAECTGNSQLKCGEGEGFRFEFRSFGDRVKWCDLDNIWLIMVLPSHLDGYCDVVETSLSNITHGMGSSWSDFGFGDFCCRCNDPRLGWGREKVLWNKLIANGKCKLYVLLDDGMTWGRRHGRSLREFSKLKNRLARLNEKGVLIELVPVAASGQECVLQCQ